MGFSIKIMPGVRIRASSRGIRASAGPRAARIHVGGGRTGFSTGVGPVSYYTSGRRRTSGGRASRSMEPTQAQAEKAAAYEEVAQAERNLTSAHLQEFMPAQTPRIPELDPVDAALLRRTLRDQALEGVPRWRLTARAAGRRQAAQQLPVRLEAEAQRRAEQHAADEAAAAAEWTLLVDGDAAAMRRALEARFTADRPTAVVLSCQGANADIALFFATTDALVPDRKRAITPSGAPTLHKRTKTERNTLYLQAVSSTVLAAVKEAFAAAPSLQQVTVLAVRFAPEAQGLGTTLTAIYVGQFRRGQWNGRAWPDMDPVSELSRTPGAMLRLGGRTGDMLPLDLSDQPDIDDVMRKLRDAA